MPVSFPQVWQPKMSPDCQIAPHRENHPGKNLCLWGNQGFGKWPFSKGGSNNDVLSTWTTCGWLPPNSRCSQFRFNFSSRWSSGGRSPSRSRRRQQKRSKRHSRSQRVEPVAIPQQVPLLGRSYYRRINTIPRGRQYYGFNSMAYKKEHNSWRKRSRKRSGIRSPFRSCKNDGLIGQSFFVKRGTQVHLFYI